MNRITKQKEDALIAAFLAGKSLRDACQLVGVSKNTAHHVRARLGGMDSFRAMGAKFKFNRWESTKK